MSLNPGDRLDCLVVREGKDDKRHFTKVGALFVNKDYSITVKLDALPITGELYCRPPREFDNDSRGGGQSRPKSEPKRGGFGGGFRNRRPQQQEDTDFPAGDGNDDGPIG